MKPGLTGDRPFQGGERARAEVVERIVPELLARFPEGVAELPTPFDVPQLQLHPKGLVDVCRYLKAIGFNLLIDVGGADYLPREPRFEVVYHLAALPELYRLRLRVMLPGDKPEPDLPSVGGIWPAAYAAECEVFDQFGIRFLGHPNLRRVLNPDDWQGYPLRRDYPMEGPRALSSDRPPAERNRFFPIRLEVK